MLHANTHNPPPQMADVIYTIMVLCRGTRENDNPFWAYMAIRPSDALEFKRARDSGTLNLEDFGTIIDWGEGEDPPEEVKTHMRTTYGMRDDYEDLLLQAIDKRGEGG